MATTYYVRKTGSDANNGLSAGAAKLTIQAAVNLATTAGDIVYVGAGSYRETVTLAASGSAGNVISIIGDYAGTQTGDAGAVRITGSDNDQTATRANCITATSRSYVSLSRLSMDSTTSHQVSLTSCVGITIDACSLHGTATSNTVALISCVGVTQSALTVKRCLLTGTAGWGVRYNHSATVDNSAHVLENCVISIIGYFGQGVGVYIDRVGGITVRNCYIRANTAGMNQATALSAGQTITVNNCIFHGCQQGLVGSSTAFIVEDYNCIASSGTARTNVTAGANSNTRHYHPDARWWQALVGGGTIVSPFDLASYSGLVELNSGTGAPSTDMRGATVKGSFREWGPLEYDSSLSVSGGSALGLPIVGSAIVRGVG